jgi:hypothetical protein
VGEPALDRGEALLAGRRISAQGEDVVHLGRDQFVHHLSHLAPGGPHAGQVRDGFDVGVGLDPPDQIDGLLAGGPSGSIGHRDVGRLELLERQDGLVKVPEPDVVARREKLERQRGRVRFDAVDNLHKTVRPAFASNGSGRIRTFEGDANGFTARPLWPLGYTPRLVDPGWPRLEGRTTLFRAP